MTADTGDLPVGERPDAPDIWSAVLRTADVFATDPLLLGGLRLKSQAGPVRDSVVEILQSRIAKQLPWLRMTPSIADDHLVDGYDLAATLAQRELVARSGILSRAKGGILIIAMAERLTALQAALIAAAIDRREITVLLLDEGLSDEAVHPCLLDRVSLTLDLSRGRLLLEPGSTASALPDAQETARDVEVPEPVMEACCALALALNRSSMRAPSHLLNVTRILAYLDGEATASTEALREAVGLVFGLTPIAAEDDSGENPESPDIPQPDTAAESEPERNRAENLPQDLEDSEHAGADETIAVDILDAYLPEDVLQAAAAARGARGGASSGKRGPSQRSVSRGRRLAARPRPENGRSALDIIATLRAAVPWQTIRRIATSSDAATGRPIAIRREDFRYTRFSAPSETLAIFAVDASGSSAHARLGEAKGAIETLLGQCYARRDAVALIVFRGAQAEIVLPPTRSLLRARRALVAMAGGGPTPLAGGLALARLLAGKAAERGQNAITILMTDGRANIALDGTAGRERAEADTQRMAAAFRLAGLSSVLVDTARRPREHAADLARAMGGEYLPLPAGRAKDLSLAVRSRMDRQSNARPN
ncbi:VWA domain-containing protein [Rhizobium sp. EC-SD404]|uniref:VWA domain-containing protein n=1 Tax=Rhizobium sp. EC-SD404 TaxID=2038389 RepID=UPI0012528BEE|nr:VWA domain-containing protein [Rhizobium sp. EC-SD404]VVT04242.1 putative Magnesium-chelatase 60 kDa subunit [Rhizobium sp. EC-SD404]